MSDAQTQRSYPVTLPIGHADAAGAWHRRGAIRKLRGTDEELFYDTGLNGAELVTQLIHRSLVRLEGVERLEKKLIEQLYCADRNYLLLELRRVTFGDVLRAHTLGARRRLHEALNAAPGVDFLRSVTCPDCGAAFEAVMDVSDFFVVN